jgi:uracil-DNA glycosylase
MSKRSKLLALAHIRKTSRWPGYSCIGDYHHGAYECDHVSPYTKAASNVDSKIFVLLQDWSSDLALSRPLDEGARSLGYTPTEPTNENLSHLLDRHLRVSMSQVFATNLFPFVKPGAMSDRIPRADLVRAAIEFAIPQVNIVEPSLVICLGLVTFNAVRKACGHRSVDNITQARAAVFQVATARVWCQAHTGALGRINRNRGGIDRVNADWSAMAESLHHDA